MGYKGNDGLNEARFQLRVKRKTPLLDLMSEDELGILFGCTTKTLYYWRREFSMPYITLGRDVYYSETQIYRWMLSRQVQITKTEEEETELPIVYKNTPTVSKKQKSVSGKLEESKASSKENKDSFNALSEK